MLSAKDVCVRYARHLPWVLDRVSLELCPGQVVGLAGPSGIGKSTLARVMSGMQRPAAGSVTIDGEPVRVRHGAPLPVQLVVQHAVHAMNPRWRVRDVLSEVGGTVRGGKDLAGASARLVEDHWLDRFPHELSGGQLQRVNLARTLRAEPQFVIADEITASLDALTQARLWELLLGEVRERGLGLLVVSHDDDLLGVVCDDVVRMGVVPTG